VAADLLSQAEHGPDSQAILVSSSLDIAKAVHSEVEQLKQQLSRADSVEKSLSQSRLLVFDDTIDMVDFVNDYAPEHLIISMAEPWQVADKITAAGSVFIGNYSPESAGDYASGTNHTLPTGGWARSFSGVNIDSFIRKITYQELSQEGLQRISGIITTMARAEGLDAHALAVEVRR
jgi:histidinol dehydrogenase